MAVVRNSWRKNLADTALFFELVVIPTHTEFSQEGSEKVPVKPLKVKQIFVWLRWVTGSKKASGLLAIELSHDGIIVLTS